MRKFTREDINQLDKARRLEAFDKRELIDYILENVNSECVEEFIKEVE